MAKAELILIPHPGMGHLRPAVELAKRLVARDERVSVTTLIMKLPLDQINSFTQSLLDESSASTGNDRINIVQLPDLETPPDTTTRGFILKLLLDYKPIIKKTLEDRDTHPIGFILDLFCTALMSIASEFRVPSYIFFTSSASFLSFLLHLQSLRDDHGFDVARLTDDADAEFEIPGFRNRVPCRVLPPSLRAKDRDIDPIIDQVKRYREARGILLNSFQEVDSYAIQCLSNDPDFPAVYPVGPVINLQGAAGSNAPILRWLDEQPPASVVFLCFGSMGSFGEEQIREVAVALERSRLRFVWVLRRSPGGQQKFQLPSDYDDLRDVLPEGFLDRTAGIGRVMGWAPQVEILSHPAVGGFVSHCGWNSTLEALSLGVPIAAWPMYAEQQMNAFQLVEELGLGVEVRMDYQWDMMKRSSNFVVRSEEIEGAIGELMDEENPVRNRAKEMAEVSKKSVGQGGSSNAALGRFIDELFEDVQ